MTKLTVTTIPRPVDEKPGDYRRYCNTRPIVKEVRAELAAELRQLRREQPGLARLVFKQNQVARRWADDLGRRVLELPFCQPCLDV